MRKKMNYIIVIGVISIGVMIPVLVSLLFCSAPKGTSFEGDYHKVNSIDFLYDLTYEREGKMVHELNILQQELDIIASAKDFILMDMFLFNDAYDRSVMKYPNSVERISNALISKKRDNPSIEIVFITDPINGFYGAYEEANVKRMKESGIQVIVTDLDQIRDPNPLFSGYYRTYMKWFGTKGKGWIKNPMDKDKPKVTIRNFLRLLNLKANHRKILITDQEGLITSANPHDPSSYHSNVAVKIKGEVINDIIKAEGSIAALSGETLPSFQYESTTETFVPDTKVKFVTEKAICKRLLDCIQTTQKGDKIQIGIFYMSDFSIKNALEEAAERGVLIKMIADPNKNAFGVKMNGSPNRQSLSKLANRWDNFTIKWYNIGKEQYHVKMASFTYAEQNIILLGSANYTRRNLKGYNLESDLEVVTTKDSEISKDIQSYFERIWNNEDGEYTVDFKMYEEDNFLKYKLYQLQEFTGICTY